MNMLLIYAGFLIQKLILSSRDFTKIAVFLHTEILITLKIC